MQYNFKEIELNARKEWDFKIEKPNYYVLSMWPYPSGKLHMGHLRNYLIGDVIARFKTMQGLRVLHPMGWDAFGLPAENAAIERGVHPKKWTLENIEAMKEELLSLGFSFDWSREETSCLPNYYKHEQKMFLDFYKAGIAYKKESVVNWDPVDNTVLANEQVVEGRGWRSGALVEKRLLSQWFLRISEFAPELLEDLKTLEKWPEKVKTMQENWIGRSEGCEIDFEIFVPPLPLGEGIRKSITIFTTRPETLFGASFVAISYAHPIAQTIPEAGEFIKECERGSTKAEDMETMEKKGFFTGLYAINPVNKELLPVYIANFVLMDYGTGALFGCPAHDVRDYEFAVKYHLPIKQVVGERQYGFTGLETENFIIRPFEEKDLASLTEALVELNTNPNWVKIPKSEEDVKKEARQKLQLYIKWQKEQGFSRWAVVNKDTGELAGGVGLCFFLPREGSLNPDAKKTDLELGGWFVKKFQSKGYSSEVMQEILDFAEVNLPATKIVAVTDPENMASQTILQKFGFIRKGEMFHQEYGVEYFFMKHFKPSLKEPFTGDGVICNSGFLNGLSIKEAREEMFKKFGRTTNYRLKDWGVSRQRYWGAPIPIINCPTCGSVPVPEAELPITLPEDITIEVGENPLKKHPTWRFVKCPSCKGDAERETDTLDTFFESSWYFLRFCSAGLESKAFESPIKVNDYIGGIEHAILHLLYARFFTKALKKCGYDVPFSEPFERLITQGMVCHKTFQTLEGKWLSPEEAGSLAPVNYVVGSSIKMSKSKKNVVEPRTITEKYGADTARFFIASDNPPERDMEWTEEGVASAHKFLSKLMIFGTSLESLKAKEPSLEVLKKFHKILNDYLISLEAIAFNKSVAKIREACNLAFEISKEEAKFLFADILKMLSPFTPHLAFEMAKLLKCDIKTLPAVRKDLLEETEVCFSIQVNGKLRGTVTAPKDSSLEVVKALALADFSVAKYITGEIKKEIFIKNKTLSFVV